MTPAPLPRGADVRIIAPSGVVDAAALQAGLQLLVEAGLRPQAQVDAAGLLATEAYLAGSDARRAAELQAALADPAAPALWAARGGFGMGRLLPQVAAAVAAALQRRRRWLLGFSDLTALFGLWSRAGAPILHAPGVVNLGKLPPERRAALWTLLQSPAPRQQFDCHLLLPRQATGQLSGRLLGGNLTVLASLCGTAFLPDFAGALVFLEDVTEAPYRLDRAATQLRQSGALQGAQAIVLGQFDRCAPPLDGPAAGRDAAAAVSDALAPLGLPICAGLPVGHDLSTSLPLLLGGPASLQLQGSRATLVVAA